MPYFPRFTKLNTRLAVCILGLQIVCFLSTFRVYDDLSWSIKRYFVNLNTNIISAVSAFRNILMCFESKFVKLENTLLMKQFVIILQNFVSKRMSSRGNGYKNIRLSIWGSSFIVWFLWIYTVGRWFNNVRFPVQKRDNHRNYDSTLLSWHFCDYWFPLSFWQRQHFSLGGWLFFLHIVKSLL